MDRIHQHDKVSYFNRLGREWDAVVGNDNARVAKLSKVIRGMSLSRGINVLDIGCGNGILIPLISKYVAPGGIITAVDQSPVMIETARLKNSSIPDAEFVSGSIENMVLKKKFYGAAIAFAVFPHIDDKAAALKNIRTALADGRSLYIFHLADTKSLNDFHASLDAPVNMDVMPERDELLALLNEAGYTMVNYIDEPGLNFAEARPCVP